MMYLITAISLGLLSSVHCIGMCGPIAMLIKQKSPKAGILHNYQAGRILGYSLLGLLFGLFGKGLSIAGVQQQVSLVMGVFMVLTVLIPALNQRSKQIESFLLPYHKKLKEVFSEQLNIHHAKNRFAIGMLNSLLPCGMIYLALMGALNADSVLMGGLFMTFFGLGTIPLFSLVLFGQGKIKSKSFKLAINKALPTLVLLMGIALIIRGAGLGFHFSPSYGELSIASFKACFSPN